MKIDLVFFDEEMLVSKETRDWKGWQDKLFYYKASLTFNDKSELLEYLKFEYKLINKDVRAIEDLLMDNSTKYFLIDINNDQNKVELTKTSLDFLGNKGELVCWKEWCWVLSKVKDEFYLWVYLGGIAEMAREIKLSDKQKNDFLTTGKQFVEELAEQLQGFNSTVYSDAIREGRKIM